MFFETLCTKNAKKKCEKQRFLSFLHDVPQKVRENSVFSRFSRHFVQRSQKIAKKQRFLSSIISSKIKVTADWNAKIKYT